MPYIFPEQMFADDGPVDVNNYEDIAERIQRFGQLVSCRPAVFYDDEFSEGRMLQTLKTASGKAVRVVARCSDPDPHFEDWKELRLLSVPGFNVPQRSPRLDYLLHAVEGELDLMGNSRYGREQLFVVPHDIGKHLDKIEPAPVPRMETVPSGADQTPRDCILRLLCGNVWFSYGQGLRAVESVEALRAETEECRAAYRVPQDSCGTCT